MDMGQVFIHKPGDGGRGAIPCPFSTLLTSLILPNCSACLDVIGPLRIIFGRPKSILSFFVVWFLINAVVKINYGLKIDSR